MVKEIVERPAWHTPIGGASAHSIGGEYCTVITDGGKRYTGTIP